MDGKLDNGFRWLTICAQLMRRILTQSAKDLAQLRGVETINSLVRPGPDGSRYVAGRFTVHRNIYRIPLP